MITQPSIPNINSNTNPNPNNQKINAEDIQNFVRSRVNHSYNKQVFDKQLNEEIKNNMMKMQQYVIKQMKRKLILKNQDQVQLEKRQRIKKQLEAKLSKSQSKREKQSIQKVKEKQVEQKIRNQVFVERMSEIKKKQLQITEDRLKELFKKQERSQIRGPTYNKINRSVSLLEQPHYKKKLRIDEQNYNRLKNKVQDRDAFKTSQVPKRQLSLSQIKPRQTLQAVLQKQRINRMGEHLQRIEQSRKKREQIMNQKIKNHQLMQKQISYQRNQRIKLLLQEQEKRQEKIISKLSKSVMPASASALKSISSASKSKLNKQSPQQLRGSVIFQLSQDRQKHSYRKQIKQKIRQYMSKQKQKLLI